MLVAVLNSHTNIYRTDRIFFLFWKFYVKEREAHILLRLLMRCLGCGKLWEAVVSVTM